MSQNVYTIPVAGTGNAPPAYNPNQFPEQKNPNYYSSTQFSSNYGVTNNAYQTTSEPIRTEPVVVRQQITIPGIQCPNCSNNVVPLNTTKPNSCTWISCCCLFLFLPICCWIPFCIPSCQDQASKCPNCGYILAEF